MNQAASFVLLKLIALVLPLRATAADETTGLDVTLHGEEAYVHDRGVVVATAPFAEVPSKVRAHPKPLITAS
jgi:hypothetical protein